VADAIAVLNASSSTSSSRSSSPAAAGSSWTCGATPKRSIRRRFLAKDCAGHVRAEKSRGEGARLGHEGALDHLRAFLSGELADDRLVGVGHRFVHGGATYTRPLRLDRSVLAALEQLVPLAPLHQPPNLAPIRLLLPGARSERGRVRARSG
jgi:acetate kinase